jgi:hypothetical protein
MSQPIPRTLVEPYLRNRGITALRGTGNLRFRPHCYYRPDRDMPTESWPAMIAAVTDLGGRITGAHRTCGSIATVSLALGIVLNIIGLGFFCWVLLTLAIYALPFFVGMTAGLYAHGAGAGPFGAIVLGLLAAAFTLVIGQTIFSLVRTPVLRIAVALMSAVPAALAGYYATFRLSGLTITSVPWRQVFAVIGAVVIGVTVWARLAASPPGGSGAPGRPTMS